MGDIGRRVHDKLQGDDGTVVDAKPGVRRTAITTPPAGADSGLRKEGWMMEVYEGYVRVFRTARITRGRWMMPDRRKPPWTTVIVVTDQRTASGHGWQLRFGDRSPVHGALLRHEGCRVQVRCGTRPYSNGLGAYALRAKFSCLNPDEHVLAVLAGRGAAAPLASAKRPTP